MAITVHEIMLDFAQTLPRWMVFTAIAKRLHFMHNQWTVRTSR